MKKDLIKQINVKNRIIGIMKVNGVDYISLTDLARYRNSLEPSDLIKKWMSNYDTIEYIGLWEELNNLNFNSAEFRQIKTEAPKKSFSITPSKWCLLVNPIGIISDRGKYSIGTFAHPDIAFEFASWLDNLFKLYLIKEFERLKKKEYDSYKLDWNANRILSKLNYVIHTDAIKNYIVPNLTNKQKNTIYSEEADILNVALFGKTAKEWRKNNPDLKGNIRDNTDLLHLVILNNLENINASLIELGLTQKERLIKLNKNAKKQIETIIGDKRLEELSFLDKTTSKLLENKK